jgi:hypothetical protein
MRDLVARGSQSPALVGYVTDTMAHATAELCRVRELVALMILPTP